MSKNLTNEQVQIVSDWEALRDFCLKFLFMMIDFAIATYFLTSAQGGTERVAGGMFLLAGICVLISLLRGEAKSSHLNGQVSDESRRRHGFF